MRVDEFDYVLPPELIAQTPLKNRVESRLMVVDRNVLTIEHKKFNNILDYLNENDVVNLYVKIFLTAINVYSKIGKFAGAGSIVPITGFANSVVSPAIEYKTEGYVMGVGSKMFTVAGPVIVYGISSSIIVGLFYILFYTFFIKVL